MVNRKKNAVTPEVRSSSSVATPAHGVVRIVGGLWRRTPLLLKPRAGLRPTPERVRETVFDWTAHLLGSLEGRAVLDLFAGSGAMGLEAASRGASVLDAVERDRASAEGIRSVLTALRAPEDFRVHTGDAFAFLSRARAEGRRYDLIVVDPPYALSLQERALSEARDLLAPEGLFYVESPGEHLSDETLGRLRLCRVRSGRAGECAFELLALPESVTASRAKLSKTEKRLKRKEKTP